MALPQDAAAILVLQRLAYASEARLYDDWTLPPLVQTLDSLQEEMQRATVLKATLGATLVGSVRATLQDDVCHIGRLIVHPHWQGRGIGTALLATIEAAYPHSNRFELFTGSRSEGNIRLYRRCGYAITRTEELSASISLVVLSKLNQTAKLAPDSPT